MSYRKNFAPLLIEKQKVEKLTSDAGWGCVIRCQQMLVASAYQKVLRSQVNARYNEVKAKLAMRVLDLFDDDKRGRPEAPFSIQNIVELGLEEH